VTVGWLADQVTVTLMTFDTRFKHLVNNYFLSTVFYWLYACKCALYVRHTAFCLLTSLCDFWFYAYV